MTNARMPVPCTVCGGLSATALYEPERQEDDPARLYGAASGIPGTQRIVRCNECGMIYESPRLPDAMILGGYMASCEAGHDSQYPMRVQSFLSALKKHASVLPPKGSKVLDIGTAGGAFLEAARLYGYDAWGLEPSSFLVQQGKRRGLQIEQGTIDSHSFQAGSFDLICLWDVIEHLTSPRSALESIRHLLKPDGILLINYPDIGTTQAKIFGKRFWWIISVHLHHFSRRSITDILRRTGYEPISFRRYWQQLQFGYLEDMAVHYRVPLAGLLKRLTPQLLQRVTIPYYASQTTALARISK